MLLFHIECLVTRRNPSNTDLGDGDDTYYVKDSQEKM